MTGHMSRETSINTGEIRGQNARLSGEPWIADSRIEQQAPNNTTKGYRGLRVESNNGALRPGACSSDRGRCAVLRWNVSDDIPLQQCVQSIVDQRLALRHNESSLTLQCSIDENLAIWQDDQGSLFGRWLFSAHHIEGRQT